MKKKLLILLGIVFICILVGFALLRCAIIVGYTPIFKECSDFNPEEIKIIEEELSFELGDDAKIVNTRFAYARDTEFLLWIEGIEDKNDFVKRNGLEFKGSGEYDVTRNVNNRKYQEAELYTSPKNEANWHLYRDGNTWSVFVESSHISEKTYKLFERVRNQYRWIF